MLHQLWTERCQIVHESTVAKIRVEDYHELLVYVRRIYRYINLEHHSILGQYKSRLDILNTDTLQEIVYEVISSYDLDTDSDIIIDYIRNLTSHKRRELNSLILECRDKVTIRRHRNLKQKRDSTEDD